MPRTPIAFPTSSNPARYGHAGDARLINVYPETLGQDAKAPTAWWACDGLADFSTLSGGGELRAMLALSDSDLYVVAERVLYRVDAAGANSILGGISSDGLVTMAANRVGQIAVVCDGLYYGVQSGVLTQLADPDLPPPMSVCEQDGYFLFFLQDGRFFWSSIDDWAVDGLDTATAEANRDGGVRNITRGRDVVFFGNRSTEFWSDTGAETPFARTTANDLGCLAGGSVVELEQTIYWVCHDGTVRMLNGYQGQRVSSHAVERFIAEETTPANLTACSWQARGHSFYALSGENGTWCYDASTGSWFERSSYGLERWRVQHTVQLGTRIIAGDYSNGKLYTMSPDTYDESGSPLICSIQPAPVYANGVRVRHNRIELDVIPGTGLVSTDESLADPQVMIDYSDDGGASFSTQRMRSTGRAGQRLTRVFATRLGMSRSRTYRFSISDGVARGFVSAFGDLDPTKA